MLCVMTGMASKRHGCLMDSTPFNVASQQSEDVTLFSFKYLEGEEIGRGKSGNIRLVEKIEGPKSGVVFARKKFRHARGKVPHGRCEAAILRTLTQECRYRFFPRLHWVLFDEIYSRLVMDYYCGGNLTHWMSRFNGFSDEQARFYGAEILCAIDYLHEKNIIHRDITTCNVVLDGHCHAVIIDMGLAIQMAPDAPTGCKEWFSSQAHLAPEMYTPSESGYLYEVDYWSFGILIHILVTKKMPVISTGGENIQVKLRTSAGHALTSLLEGLLQVDRRKRFGETELRESRFFQNVDWSKVKNREIPAPASWFQQTWSRSSTSVNPKLPTSSGKGMAINQTPRPVTPKAKATGQKAKPSARVSTSTRHSIAETNQYPAASSRDLTAADENVTSVGQNPSKTDLAVPGNDPTAGNSSLLCQLLSATDDHHRMATRYLTATSQDLQAATNYSAVQTGRGLAEAATIPNQELLADPQYPAATGPDLPATPQCLETNSQDLLLAPQYSVATGQDLVSAPQYQAATDQDLLSTIQYLETIRQELLARAQSPAATGQDLLSVSQDPAATNREFPAAPQSPAATGQNLLPAPQYASGSGQDLLAGPQCPLATGQDLLAGPQHPLATGQDLLAGPQHPLATGQDLLAGPQYPAATGQDILTGPQFPLTTGQDLLAGPQYPAATGQDLLAGPQHPLATGQDLLAGPQHPLATGQDLLAGPQYPAATGQDILAGPQFPLTTGQDLLAGPQYPAATGQDLLAGPQYPLAIGQDFLACPQYPLATGQDLLAALQFSSASGWDLPAAPQCTAVTDQNLMTGTYQPATTDYINLQPVPHYPESTGQDLPSASQHPSATGRGFSAATQHPEATDQDQATRAGGISGRQRQRQAGEKGKKRWQRRR